MMKNYSLENTALLIVDPFNDFLSEGDKLWSLTKETVFKFQSNYILD
jgi:nicotinamidase-related amidase